MLEEFCRCGSGRLHGHCHGLRGRLRRGRGRELHALAEVHAAGVFVPILRPRGDAFAAYAQSTADAIGAAPREASPAETEAGIALLDADEQRRLVDTWVERYPMRRAAICAEVPDPTLVERALVASAVRAAIMDRRACPRGVIAQLEGGQLERSPAAAVTLALSHWPQAVWSYEEAAAYVAGEPIGIGEEHVPRVRAQSERLAARLPEAGLPRASATLLGGCSLVARELRPAIGVAELLLHAYELQLDKHASYSSRMN